MKIINYNNCEFVEFNHSVSVLDLQTNEKFHCMIVPTLTSEMFESVVNKYGNNGEIFKFPNSGKVWVHTPFGGAIYGRRENDEFGFYEQGVLKRYKVIKIFS